MSTHVSHREVWYSGRVQGVGFRAGVLAVSRGYEVTGYVQNLTDGRVYLHVEGAESELEEFLIGVAERMDGHIKGEEVRSFSGVRTCRDYSIRR